MLSIDLQKDRQENAIYAFTIVTVVFLPLSTIAGILGMNTNDIRNMEDGQWIFWVAALPLLVLVIGLCLAWTGEMGTFVGAAKRLLGIKTTQGPRARARSRYHSGDGGHVPQAMQLPMNRRSSDSGAEYVLMPARRNRGRNFLYDE